MAQFHRYVGQQLFVGILPAIDVFVLERADTNRWLRIDRRGVNIPQRDFGKLIIGDRASGISGRPIGSVEFSAGAPVAIGAVLSAAQRSVGIAVGRDSSRLAQR